MRRICLLLLILSGAATAIRAQDVVSLSLEDCMSYAVKHNYNIKNARLDVQIQAAQYNQTLSAALPHINGKAEFDDYLVPQKTFIPAAFFGGQAGEYDAVQFVPQYNLSGSVSGSQTLFDGSILVALQARKLVSVLANQAADVTEEGVRYNVYRAYNALVVAYRQYNIIKNSLHYARSVEHDIIVTQQTGFAEKIDVERTKVQVNNLATDSIRVSSLLDVSAQALKYQMGMNIYTPIVLTDTNLEAHRTEALSLLETEKEYNRVPEFNLYNTQLTLNEYSVKRYQYAALPSLSLISNAGYNYASEDFNQLFYYHHYLPYALVGLQLNVPIFNGFLRVNQLKEAKLNVEKSRNNIDNVKLTIDFQSAQSHTTLNNALLQAENQHRNLDLANDVLDLAQKKYKAGVGSNLEVTQAQTDQLMAQNNYFNALLDVINAEADLKRALGLLK